MRSLKSVLQAERELNEDFGLGDQLLEGPSLVTGGAKKDLTGELDYLGDLRRRHSQALQLRKITRPDLLQRFKHGLLFAHALFVQRLVTLDALSVTLQRRFTSILRLHVVSTGLFALARLAFLAQGQVLSLKLRLFLCPLLLSKLDP